MKRRTTTRSRRGIAQKWLIIGGVAAALIAGAFLIKMLKKNDRHDQHYQHDGFYQQQQNYSQTFQDQQDCNVPGKGGGGYSKPGYYHNGRYDLEPMRGYGPGAPDSDSDTPAAPEDTELAELKAAADAAQLRLQSASSENDPAAMMSAQTELSSARARLAAKMRSML